MQTPFVKLDVENSIGTITFYTPDHNALPGASLNELAATISKAGNTEHIKVLILKSGGERTFCAGASFKELIAINDAEAGKSFFMGFAKVILAMRACPLLIICRVQGKTVGGGVGIAAAADYCMATKFASVKLSELTIGIGPFVIEPALTRKMGISVSSQMTINATEFYSAEWAKSKGLYAEVFESADLMDDKILQLASDLASYNPEALTEAKKMFWKNTDDWPYLLENRAAQSGKLVVSDFTKEKLKAYS